MSSENGGVFDPIPDESDGDDDKDPVVPFNEKAEAVRENFDKEQIDEGNETRPKLKFMSPLELMEVQVPKDYVMVGDYHLSRGEVSVIGGAPGVGKSRAGTALAVAGATGEDWFGLKIHRKFKTLILQNENGFVRLKSEYTGMKSVAPEVINDYIRVSPPPPMGLDFENKDFRGDLAQMMKEFEPDVLLLDPWNAVAKDETMRAYQDAYEMVRRVLPKKKPPALVIVAHTRKPRVGDRANGRALLNLLSGSYLLGSVARSVFVLLAASDDPEDQKVVMTCCKNNNGQLGKRTAWVRGNGLFDEVEGFDWEAFDGSGKGAEAKPGKVTVDHLRAVFEHGEKQLSKADAVKEIQRTSGCGLTKAYDVLKLDGEFAMFLKLGENSKMVRFFDEQRENWKKQNEAKLNEPLEVG